MQIKIDLAALFRNVEMSRRHSFIQKVNQEFPMNLLYGYCMVIVWLLYGNSMVIVWLLYGYCMVIVWLLYGYCMVIVWLRQGRGR